jgi:hypothetical protein
MDRTPLSRQPEIEMSPVKIAEIRRAIHTNDYGALRSLSRSAKLDGVEQCDDQKISTLALCMLQCSLFAGASPGHTRQLEAMLDAIERGNHPYDDTQATATFEADAAIARAQLNAMVGHRE